ncbi:MAG TPA: N-formylglutamate amidohydrolase [Alphaproteobacteria bacterium]|nr:N-formylglutamate amidohydrolase [Alphaproteobacteria bacterium]
MPAPQKNARKILTVSRAKTLAETCLVADSPHSGRVYPADFNYSCNKDVLRQAEDAWIDKLFDFLPDLGIPFLQAKFPRSYIDANRNADKVIRDFNAAAKRGEQPAYQPTEGGLIRSPVTPRHQTPVYNRTLSLREAFARATQYHQPYHRRLAAMIGTAKEKHGRVVHLNCHSMPSTIHRGTKLNSYDVILGTRDGTTADDKLLYKLKDLLEAKGYKVGLNTPGFRGAEIVHRYGQPALQQHSIQIEINRALYMNEKSLRSHRGMRRLRQDLKEVISDFRDYCDHLPPPNVLKKVPKSVPKVP